MKKKALNKLSSLKKLLEVTPEIDKAFACIEKAIDEQVEEAQAASAGEMLTPKEVEGNASAIAAFSDGGCRGNPGPGAWGIVIQDSDGSIIHEDSDFTDYTTNNQMELTGAIKCLEYIKDNHPFKSDIHLFTDSKYVVDGMGSWVAGWKRRGWKKADKKPPENLSLWQHLDQLSIELGGVNFHWVKGHAGHPQNERCDQLANQVMDANI